MYIQYITKNVRIYIHIHTHNNNKIKRVCEYLSSGFFKIHKYYFEIVRLLRFCRVFGVKCLLDGLQKIFEGFYIFGLTLKCVADVVEQFGISLIDFETGTEDRLLRLPVPVANVGLQAVES